MPCHRSPTYTLLRRPARRRGGTNVINTCAELAYIREHYKEYDSDSGKFPYLCNYYLNNNLDMSATSWETLGARDNCKYKKTFYGNNHTIRNCWVAMLSVCSTTTANRSAVASRNPSSTAASYPKSNMS